MAMPSGFEVVAAVADRGPIVLTADSNDYGCLAVGLTVWHKIEP